MSEEDIEEKKLVLFGRDLASIPCFRSSYLYGICGGIGTGLVYFMCTSKTRLSTNVGFSSFMAITLTYWFYCRYQWSQDRFNMRQIQAAMKKQAIFEGTEVERSLLEKVKSKS